MGVKYFIRIVIDQFINNFSGSILILFVEDQVILGGAEFYIFARDFLFNRFEKLIGRAVVVVADPDPGGKDGVA